MARARNIKPAFFTNELLGTEDPMICLTFAGLWCLADKMGVLEDRPLRIKAELFPYRDSLDVNGYLTVLARLGFIVRYKNENRAFIQVCNFRKHQSPHNTEKAKGYPFYNDPKSLIVEGNGYGTVNESLVIREEKVSERPDSLIPDCGFTDSLIPDSKALQSADAPVIEKKVRKPKPAPDDQAKEANGKTWQAYADSYFNRYGAEPVRNQKVNSLVAQLVKRIGAEEAPHVAFYFVTINDSFLIKAVHDIGLLVSRAEAYRTQWATNMQMNGTTARQLENTQSNLSAAEQAKKMMREGGLQNAFLKR